jgi:hypothetical protein
MFFKKRREEEWIDPQTTGKAYIVGDDVQWNRVYGTVYYDMNKKNSKNEPLRPKGRSIL